MNKIKHEFSMNSPMYWIVIPIIFSLVLLTVMISVIMFNSGTEYVAPTLILIFGLIFWIPGFSIVIGMVKGHKMWSYITDDYIEWGSDFSNKTKGKILKCNIKNISIDYWGESENIYVTLKDGSEVRVCQAAQLFGTSKQLCSALDKCDYNYK